MTNHAPSDYDPDSSYVPCAIEGCTFAFQRDFYLAAEREGFPRADVLLTDFQGIPQPITLLDGRELCLAPGCLRDLANATRQSPPDDLVRFSDLVTQNKDAYKISTFGPDSEGRRKIEQAYRSQDGGKELSCIVGGCDRVLRVTGWCIGSDPQTNYFAEPPWKQNKQTEDGRPYLCALPNCGRESAMPTWCLGVHAFDRHYIRNLRLGERLEPEARSLGSDVDSDEPVDLPYDIRTLGVTVLGQTGYGKTTLLEQLILQDIEQGTSVIVVDAHGDLTQRVLSLAETDDEENLLLLEAWEDAPFRLNLFDCPDPTSTIAVDRTVSGIVQVFKRLFGSPREFYPRLERDLGNAARTVIANQGTMLDVPRLFWDAEVRAAALEQVSNQRVHEFWALWQRIGRADRQLEQLEATINRLDQFLASEFVAQLIGSTESTIPFDEVLAGDGRVLLVNLPVGEIGEGLTNLLGSLFLAVLTERIFARARLAPGSRSRVHLYLDEYGRYATPTTAQLLTEGRKFGIGTTIAHQTRAQISDEENRAAELQVGSLICFQLIGADAQELSGEFHVAPEPQWEERVEEIEGTEPVLGVTQNPVDHLLSAGHRSAAVRAQVVALLPPLAQAIEEARHDNSTEQRLLRNGSLRQLERGRFLIDRYLVACMEQGSDNPATRFEQRVEIFLELRGHIRLEPSADYSEKELEVGRHTERHLRKLLSISRQIAPQDFFAEGDSTTADTVFTPSTTMVWQLISFEPGQSIHRYFMQRYHDERDRLARAFGRGQRKQNDRRILGAKETEALELSACLMLYGSREDKEDVNNKLIAAYRRLFTYDEALVRLGELLADEPILVATGQEKPRVRVRYITHPQRSYQDVQNELAVQLANLPRFTAYTSIQGEQHQLRLSPPAEAAIDEARIERIRQISKTRFGRPPEPRAPRAERRDQCTTG